MRNRWVVNASPLILLAKAAHIDLLFQLANRLVIPEGVAREVRQGPENDPARQWLDGAGAQYVTPDAAAAETLIPYDLGTGETAVLSFALQNPGFEAILDDRAARKCASTNGIPYRGTLGVVLAARKQNLIPAAKPLCETLVNSGLLINPHLVIEALKLVGE